MEDSCPCICNLIILLQVTRETLEVFLLVNKHDLRHNAARGPRYLPGSCTASSSLPYICQQCTQPVTGRWLHSFPYCFLRSQNAQEVFTKIARRNWTTKNLSFMDLNGPALISFSRKEYFHCKCTGHICISGSLGRASKKWFCPMCIIWPSLCNM